VTFSSANHKRSNALSVLWLGPADRIAMSFLAGGYIAKV